MSSFVNDLDKILEEYLKEILVSKTKISIQRLRWLMKHFFN
jgi:hypothetical protein